MIQTILFATDLGIHTPYLLHHVNALAAQHRARVVVLHVIEQGGQLNDAVLASYLSAEQRNEFQEHGIKRITASVKSRIVDLLEEEFIEGQEGLLQVRDVRVVPGKPVDVIVREASACRADLIIMGSHGPNTVTPNILGSVTSRVLQMSRVPVYMVPLIRSVIPQAAAG